jgi:hypothetical protein
MNFIGMLDYSSFKLINILSFVVLSSFLHIQLFKYRIKANLVVVQWGEGNGGLKSGRWTIETAKWVWEREISWINKVI